MYLPLCCELVVARGAVAWWLWLWLWLACVSSMFPRVFLRFCRFPALFLFLITYYARAFFAFFPAFLGSLRAFSARLFRPALFLFFFPFGLVGLARLPLLRLGARPNLAYVERAIARVIASCLK